MTSKLSNHISGNTLLVYVFPVSCYLVYICTQDDKYDLLYKRTKKLYKLLLDDTIIFLHM